MYEDYDMMKVALQNVAKNIAKSGTPKGFNLISCFNTNARTYDIRNTCFCNYVN